MPEKTKPKMMGRLLCDESRSMMMNRLKRLPNPRPPNNDGTTREQLRTPLYHFSLPMSISNLVDRVPYAS